MLRIVATTPCRMLGDQFEGPLNFHFEPFRKSRITIGIPPSRGFIFRLSFRVKSDFPHRLTPGLGVSHWPKESESLHQIGVRLYAVQ